LPVFYEYFIFIEDIIPMSLTEVVAFMHVVNVCVTSDKTR